MSSDLAKHSNWSVSFHRWLQASKENAPTEVADFLDWMKEKSISKKSVEGVLRRAKNAQDAADKLAALAGRKYPKGYESPLSKSVAPVVPKLVDQFLRQREVLLKREQANIERMRSKFKAKKVVEAMLV